MRELRKETETVEQEDPKVKHIFTIRNERTPKGDGNIVRL